VDRIHTSTAFVTSTSEGEACLIGEIANDTLLPACLLDTGGEPERVLLCLYAEAAVEATYLPAAVRLT
jgi:hypothetical protein